MCVDTVVVVCIDTVEVMCIDAVVVFLLSVYFFLLYLLVDGVVEVVVCSIFFCVL